jgi:hypothetical protein
MSIDNNFLKGNPIAQEIIGKIDKWNYIKLKKLVNIKGNNYQSEEIFYRMGEYFCQLFIR